MTEPTLHAELRRFLELLYEPGDVFEVRAPKCRERRGSSYTSTVCGYFTFEAIDSAVGAIANLDTAGLAPGIYVTLNPVRPDLLARAANRLRNRAAQTTADGEIARRGWLLVDVDPARPSGVSATEAELALASERADAVREHLSARGWPDPIRAMSGNGHHLLYRIDLPADDDGLVRRVLDALAAMFSDEAVAVDRSVFNPARIVKAIGTVARKGDDLRGIPGIEDRTHRRSHLLDVPTTIATVAEAQLEAVVAHAGSVDATRAKIAADADSDRFPSTPDGVRAWLEARGVAVKGQRPNGTKTMLLLERCPVNPEIVSTGGSDIAVLVGDDGKLAYCNKHARGQGFTWRDLRSAIDPQYNGPVTDEPAGVDLSQFMVAPSSTADCSGSASESSVVCLPELRSVKQLMSDYPRLRPPVIHGLLREGETMNVIASPKTGKSWLTLDLAIAVATGRPWLGRYETVPGEVLIIDNELHRETSAHRLPMVAHARGVRLGEVDEIVQIENLRGRLQDIFALSPYFEAIEPGRFKVIVLDAMYRFMPVGGDENDNGTMANIYNYIDRFADMLGCCFVLIHHSTKGSQSSKSVTDVGAGAGAQSRATDTHLVLRPHEEDGVVVLDAAVRSWPPIDPTCLRWDFPVWLLAPELDPADLRNERSKKKQNASSQWTPESFVNAFVRAEPRPRETILRDAVGAGLSNWRATCLLREADSLGLVRRENEGRNRPSLYAVAQSENGGAP